MARTGSLKWGVIEVECVRNAPSPFDYADRSASVEDSPGEDVAPGDCRVCALGARPPSVPPPLDIDLPSVDDPQAFVASILVDEHGLEHEAATLRAQFELAAAYNAGLAAHASVIHDRNRALLRWAREGSELGARTVNRLHEQVEALERENTRLEDEAGRLHNRAGRADSLETRCRVQERAATEHIHQLQDELDAARAENSRLSVRLKLATSPSTAPTVSSTVPPHFQDELARARADAASLQATLSAVNAELAAATSARDQTSTAAVSLSQERDAAVAELQAAQADLTQSRCVAEAAQRLNVPLEEDVRRVNALLTAHAGERQRDLARLRDLEASVSSASAARIAAEASAACAGTAELQSVGRAQRFRYVLLEYRRVAARRLERLAVREREQARRITDLDERLLAHSQREHAERPAAWRRLLREARLGRELARLVRDDLARRLDTMVAAGGGTLDLAGLQRRLETQLEPASRAAVPQGFDGSSRTTGVPSGVPTPPAVPTGPTQPVFPRPSTPATTGSTPTMQPFWACRERAPHTWPFGPRAATTPSGASGTPSRSRSSRLASAHSSDGGTPTPPRHAKRRWLRRHSPQPVSSSPSQSASPPLRHPSGHSSASADSAASDRDGSSSNSSSSSSSSSSARSSVGSRGGTGGAPFFSPAIPPYQDEWSGAVAAMSHAPPHSVHADWAA
ncbi:unnamed protein product [Phytophthora fragariaefolia]|uniref:Unnamed protein product n=1 Tax=Phytophthora fragariaefolia TaxID=1490495 RepID=A0A9W6XFG3_9STRA|nr:unnamed protein product [Phytophthora fragariaefolia]